MKAKKKRVGTKAQITAIKERERRIATAIFLASILLIVIFSAYFTYTSLNQPQNQTTNPTSNPASLQLKAAIVDHLSPTAPNQTFIQTATNTLKQAGYAVDYYPGEKVTVEFYRNLPTHGHKIIILRVHSGNNQYDTGPILLWTSEPYSKYNYIHEQLTDQIRGGFMSTHTDHLDFTIGPEFVRQSMKGKFQNSIVIAMGCESLKDNDLAKAFMERGASTFIGWSEDVLAPHTDLATTHLLQTLLIEKQTIKQAVDNTMEEVGPDPTYKSLLIYYPHEVKDQTIQDIVGN